MAPARELPRLEFYARALKVEISVKYIFSLCMSLQYTFFFVTRKEHYHHQQKQRKEKKKKRGVGGEDK